MTTLRWSHTGRRGQAAVEFALVLPMLLVMLIGIVEFGRAWNEHQVITSAAREAARKASISDEDVTWPDVLAAAENTLTAAGIDPARADIPEAGTNWDGPTDSDLTISIDLEYTFTFFGPLVNWATGKSKFDLKTRYTMRNE